MTDEMTGHVVAVVKEIRGDELAVALTGGETSLTVHDTTDFDELGGSLRLGSTVHKYTAVNDTTGVISGISPALAAAAVDTRVDAWSVAKDDVAAEWIATVADDTDGAPVEMPVAAPLVDLLKGGIRGLAGESVVCKRDGSGEWEVTTQLGQAASTSTGMVLQTDDEGNRVVIRAANGRGQIHMFTGEAGEVPAQILGYATSATHGNLVLASPLLSGNPDTATMSLESRATGGLVFFDNADVELDRDLVVGGSASIVGTLTLQNSDSLTSIRTGRKNSGATDGSSDVTVTHNLGATPTSVTLGPASSHQYSVVALSSTTFTLRLRTAAGVLVGSGVTPDVFWTAIKV